MLNKILIIGQAPPAHTQKIPYDSTHLYTMLSWVGISVEDAQDMFIFDAVYDKFPGYDSKGGHLKPTIEMIWEYWDRELQYKVKKADKIIVLGNVAKDSIELKLARSNWKYPHQVIYIPHPSKRNTKLITQQKEKITTKLKDLIYGIK